MFRGNTASKLRRAAGAGLIELMEKRLMMSNTLLSGNVIGTPGSYKNDGDIGSNAFDANLNTFYDAPDASGDWVGLDLGAPKSISQIKYAPRSGLATRMVGGVFQGSNTPDFSSGVVNLFTITAAPAAATYTTASVNSTNTFEYVRYLGPNIGYCNVADLQFYSSSTAGLAVLSNGTLSVNGTSGADNLNVEFDQFTSPQTVIVTINGVVQSFNSNSVTSLVLASGNGNDTISVTGSENGAPNLPTVSITAGDGNDSIQENLNTDDGANGHPDAHVTLAAGNGNDLISVEGSGEVAVVNAGNGNDTINSSVSGTGNLHDTITAGDGTDSFDAGSSGAAGSQTIVFNAGIGMDTIGNSDPDGYVSGTVGGRAYSVIAGDEELLGNVYADVNGNQRYDRGEPLVANKQVTFENSQAGTFTATTDNTGTYSVSVFYNSDAGTVPTYGWTQPITLQAQDNQFGELISGVDFALAQPVGGTVVGTSGSYQNDGNTIAKAFDGNLNTFFDGPTGNGDYMGRNLGSKLVVNAITYAPRAGYESRMVGGIFQGSNSSTFSGAVNLYTITTKPTAGVLTYAALSNTTAYQYVRYVSPNGSFGNAAEIQFFSAAVPGPGAVLSNGILTITGTSGPDKIQLQIGYNFDSPQEVITTTVNGIVQTFDPAAIHGYVINSGDGNDTIGVGGSYEISNFDPTIDPTNDLATTINTGNGDDQVSLAVYSTGDNEEAAPPDQINFGSGNDYAFFNQDGSSTVNGGSGNDTVQTDPVDGLTMTVNGGTGNMTFNEGQFTNPIFHGGSGINTFSEGPDYGFSNLDVNLNGPNLTNIQNYINNNDNQTVTVEASSSTQEILFTGTENAVTVTGANGNEYIQVFSQTAQINAGNGSNIISMDTSTSGTIVGGSGNDLIDTSRSTGTISIDGGGGTNTAYTPANVSTAVVNVQSVNPQFSSPFSGTIFGTTGSYQNDGNTAAKAFDGNLFTYFDGPTNSGDVIGLDLGTSHLIGSIAYAPRSGWTQRMVGGYFQSSNTADFLSPAYLFTVYTAPQAGQFSVYQFDQPLFARYIRYVAPDGSFGDVAEIQVRPPASSGPTKQAGTIIGTAGSYKNHGTTIANVFDNNFSTYFDSPDASGDWVGEDLGSAKVVTQVKFAARSGLETRMVGGMIQASNSATFSSGVVTLYTINSTPASGSLTTVALSNSTAYRYYRYIGPANGYCNIAELEFDA